MTHYSSHARPPAAQANVIVVTVVAAMLLTPQLVAQSPPAQPYAPPRTADGHPNLEGIWQVLNTAAWDLQDHSARLGVPAGRSVVEGNEIPYQPWALAKKTENYANRASLDPESKCLLSGVPRITYTPYPFQIVQQPDKVNFLYENNHALRHVYLNGNPHPKGPIDWWMGDSRGRWEGNTLVVDVVDFNDQTWFDHAGNFHSEDLHVVERYTPTDASHMLYEVTIDDPKVFTRPWKISMPLYRRVEPQPEILEYECFAYLLEETWPNK
jgi:hypothetical protein